MGKFFEKTIHAIIGSFIMFILMAVFAKFNYFNEKADKYYVDEEIKELKLLNESQHNRIEQKIDNTYPLILEELKRIKDNQDKMMLGNR